MKTPTQRLRELTKILKDDDSMVSYDKMLLNGFLIEKIWQPKVKCIFLMNDYQAAKKNKLVYINESEVSDDELLEIVEDLEKML